MDNYDLKKIWNECLQSIKVTASEASFNTWFKQTHLVSIENILDTKQVVLGCSTHFVKNAIETRYLGLVIENLTNNLKSKIDLRLVIENIQANGNEVSSPLFASTQSQQPINNMAFLNALKDARIRPSFSFENFAVSGSNQMAWAACEAVSKNIGSAYNPLFIYGGVGVGKTHLMSSVGHRLLFEDSTKKVTFCTSEDFTNAIVEGIKTKSMQNVRNKYRKLDLLMVDDIQFIAGKDTVQEEFFHTFNSIVSAGGQVILTSDKPPAEIKKLEARLRSRFEAGLIVDVAQPDFELRCAITQIKAEEKDLKLETPFVHLIAGNADGARKIEGILINIITQLAITRNNVVTEEMVQKALGGKEEDDIKLKATPQDAVEAVCKHFNISKRNLMSHSRVVVYTLPRQILMYFLRVKLGLNYKEVGHLIGGRDHTTIMHAVDKITKLLSTSVEIREDIEGIKKVLL